MKDEGKSNKVKEITEQLHEGIENLFESDRYKEYLQVMSRFTNYSFNNTVLIALQRPDASAVAGYRAWENKFDRHVKPGSKGIAIIEPAPWKKKGYEVLTDENGNAKLDADGNEIKVQVEYMVQNFKVGHVFAYEDTEGEPLPSIVSRLNGDVQDYSTFLNVLQEVSPVPVTFEEIHNGANGYYRLDTNDIHVDSRLGQLQTLKTLTHEMAHAICHNREIGEDKEANRLEREVTAESVAYTVLSYYGLDTSEYSFGYVAGWSAGKELKELQQKMDVIRKTANSLITQIDEKMMIHEMNQAQELTFKNGEGYLRIEKNGTGYDYSFYNKNLDLCDTGSMDGQAPIYESAQKIMEAYGMDMKSVVPMEVSALDEKIQQKQNSSIQEETVSQKATVSHRM